MISSSMVVLLVTFNRRLPVVMARTMFAPGILWFCGIKLRVEGADKLAPQQPYVFASNHLSYLDIPVLFAAIPHNLHFIAKESIKYVPFIGWYMMATGMIFVDRSNRMKAKESMNRAAKLVSKGKNILIFPEGARSRDGAMLPFKKGGFVLSQNAKVPVVPVAISGTEEVLKPDQWTIVPGKVSVRIGTPLEGQGLDSMAFAKRCQQEISIQHQALIHA